MRGSLQSRRARFYRSTKIRFSLILPLRESCWGVPSPNPAYVAYAAYPAAAMRQPKGGFHLAYVPVPKDLSKVKTKVAFNLTKRQIVCFAAALIIGLPLFFLLKDSTGTSLASMAMIAVMLPCFLFAMYEKHGQPLEVVVRNIIRTKFIAPKERPYRTENLYADLERQRKLEKEVSAIAKGNTKKQRGGKRACKG